MMRSSWRLASAAPAALQRFTSLHAGLTCPKSILTWACLGMGLSRFAAASPIGAQLSRSLQIPLAVDVLICFIPQSAAAAGAHLRHRRGYAMYGMVLRTWALVRKPMPLLCRNFHRRRGAASFRRRNCLSSTSMACHAVEVLVWGWWSHFVCQAFWLRAL